MQPIHITRRCISVWIPSMVILLIASCILHSVGNEGTRATIPLTPGPGGLWLRPAPNVNVGITLHAAKGFCCCLPPSLLCVKRWVSPGRCWPPHGARSGGLRHQAVWLLENSGVGFNQIRGSACIFFFYLFFYCAISSVVFGWEEQTF